MRRFKVNSIRFKASILYSSILCVILLAYSAALFGMVRFILYRNVDETLRLKAVELSNILNTYEKIEANESRPLIFVTKNQIYLGSQGTAEKAMISSLWRQEAEALNLQRDLIHVLNSSGVSIVHSQNLTPQVDRLFRKAVGVSAKLDYGDVVFHGQHLRVINFPFTYKGEPSYIVQIGTPLTSTDHVLTTLLIFICVAVMLVLILTSSLGTFFTGRILRPVLSVTRTANKLSYKDLHVRIPEQQMDTEMKYLVDSFNMMIGRLEQSFQHISEFSSHVAHELKTPLAIIRGELELALTEEHSAEEYKRAMVVALEEIDRLIKIIKDLLLLAKLDYKPDIFHFEPFDLATFIREQEEHIRILTQQKNLELRFDVEEAALMISGDKLHLRRLFLNLVNNAVKFTPPGGQVTVAVRKENIKVHLSVSDTGTGIAPEDLERIFDKFYRAQGGEQSIEFGSGLGLSIAQAIARAHGGEIRAESTPREGSRFIVTLPLA